MSYRMGMFDTLVELDSWDPESGEAGSWGEYDGYFCHLQIHQYLNENIQRRPRNKPMAREPMYHLMT